jgi:general secretion pathway protein G
MIKSHRSVSGIEGMYSQKPTMKRTQQQGMTLVEILIVVAVIAIITAIAVPNILNSVQKSRRSRAMAEMKSMMAGLAQAARNVDLSGGLEDVPISTLVDTAEFKGNTKDPWGGDYLFSFDPEQSIFVLKSLGFDNVAGASNGEFDSDIVFKNGNFVAPASVVGQ